MKIAPTRETHYKLNIKIKYINCLYESLPDIVLDLRIHVMYASTIKWFTSRTRASERSQKPENQNGHRQRSVDLDATLWGRKYQNESCDKYMTVKVKHQK